MLPEAGWGSTNAIAAYIAVFGSIITSGLVVFLTDWRRRRTEFILGEAGKQKTASEREVEARAEYVELLQRRIGDLETRLDAANAREVELTNRFRDDMYDLERRYRHLVAGIITWASFLKQRLEAKGEVVQPFSGWERFIEEGGQPRAHWRDPESGGIC